MKKLIISQGNCAHFIDTEEEYEVFEINCKFCKTQWNYKNPNFKIDNNKKSEKIETPKPQKSTSTTSLREESIRLINLQKQILETIRDDSGLYFDDINIDNKLNYSQFTKDGINASLKVLDENLKKLENFEMVLAVVGTMKAGKSTTINAIVGREILPNRNRPMTALPTLIRHSPNMVRPIMTLQKTKPLQALVEKLGQVLNGDLKDRIRKSIDADTNIQGLANKIKRGSLVLIERCEGEEAIFELLASLNDLVRLSKELEVDFPFAEYVSITDFPVIEVEFFHLRGMADSHSGGRLTLLDTPGFNEAGQSDKLMPMMKEQLSKASAVLAVLDYTQLNSDSEEKLRKELETISESAGNRMFALVNKFDQKNSNSDGEEATKIYVAKTLLNGKIAIERIFPVSSSLGYLAKRAEFEMVKNGHLGWRRGGSENWAIDFAKKVFGDFWEDGIGNAEKIKQGYQKLWERSLFDRPLTDVIQFSHQRAAYIALDAAASELKNNNDAISEMLGVRISGFDANIEKVKILVKSLHDDMESIKKLKAKNMDFIKNEIEQINKKTDEKISSVTKETTESIGQFLENGGLTKEQIISAELNSELRRFDFFKTMNPQQKEGLTRKLFNFLNNQSFTEASSYINNIKGKLALSKQKEIEDILKKEGSDPDRTSWLPRYKKSSNEVIIDFTEDVVFNNKEEAEEALKKIESAIGEIIRAAETSTSKELGETSKKLAGRMNDLVVSIGKDLNKFEDHAKDVGFQNIKINMPSNVNFSLGIHLSGHGKKIVQDKEFRYTYRSDQDSVFGWIKRKVDFFDGGWGTDRTSGTNVKFIIKKTELEEQCNLQTQKFLEDLKASVNEEFSSPIKCNSEEFFKEIETAFQSIHTNLDKVLSDAKKDESEKKRIQREVKRLKIKQDESASDIDDIEQETKKALNQQGQKTVEATV